LLILGFAKIENMIFKKVWKLFRANSCFLCDNSLDEHIKETGKRFDMHCRAEYLYLMEAWNWKTLCKDCLSVFEKIENQILN